LFKTLKHLIRPLKDVIMVSNKANPHKSTFLKRYLGNDLRGPPEQNRFFGEIGGKKMKSTRFACIAIGAALIAACVSGCSSSDYKNAMSMYEAGQYEEAATIFTELGDYEDSSAMVLTCQYEGAKSDYDAGDYDGAKETFTALGDYEDSADWVLACTYGQAKTLADAGNYEEAKALFSELGDYQDSADQITACSYDEATSLYENGDYEEAKTLFESLNGYADSSSMISACDYGSALELYENGDYEGAADIFSGLKGFVDSDQYLSDCYIAMGDARVAENDYSGAADLYLSAYEKTGSTEAADGMCACAEALIAAEDTETASDILSNLTDYEGAEDARNALAFVSGEKLLAVGDLNYALAVYQSLPTDYVYGDIAASDRIALLESHSDFLAINGEWVNSADNNVSIRQTSSRSSAWDQWDFDTSGEYTLKIICIINDDGTVTINGTLDYLYCSSYSSLSANVKTKTGSAGFTYTGTSVPSSISVSDFMTLKYSGGKFVMTYSVEDTSSSMYFDYTSAGTFTYDNRTKAY
jgi:TolA-binding protein